MKKVLVVDDEVDIGILMKMMLSSAGYEVHHASNLSAARDKLKSIHFDYVFLDLNLNGEFGLNLLPEITNNNKESKIQVAVITAQKDKEVRQLVLDKGIRCLIEKPFSKQQILQSIQLGNC